MRALGKPSCTDPKLIRRSCLNLGAGSVGGSVVEVLKEVLVELVELEVELVELDVLEVLVEVVVEVERLVLVEWLVEVELVEADVLVD